MEVLVDKVHKQGEHIPQHCYISHNHPYISSSDMLGGTISIFTATYVGMAVWNVHVAMLWNVFSLPVYFVSQCMPPFLHSAIPTFARFPLLLGSLTTVLNTFTINTTHKRTLRSNPYVHVRSKWRYSKCNAVSTCYVHVHEEFKYLDNFWRDIGTSRVWQIKRTCMWENVNH